MSEQQKHLQGSGLLDLDFFPLVITPKHPFAFPGGTLEGVGVPEELRLDVSHNHWLPSMTELLLKDPAAITGTDFQAAHLLAFVVTM